MVVFICDFSSSVRVAIPQLDVPDLLDFDDIVPDKNATGVALIMFNFTIKYL